MRMLAAQGPSIAASLGFSTEECLQLTFVLRCHDLGRHMQAGKEIPPAESAKHAEESVRLLEEWGALEGFSEGQRNVITNSILHHVTVGDIPFDKSGTVYRIAKMLQQFYGSRIRGYFEI